jgi:diguanylate cyclase (GGDEF)-like protein
MAARIRHAQDAQTIATGQPAHGGALDDRLTLLAPGVAEVYRELLAEARPEGARLDDAVARQARCWAIKATLLEMALGATSESAFWPRALAALRELFGARQVSWWVARDGGLTRAERSPDDPANDVAVPMPVRLAAIATAQVQTTPAKDTRGEVRLCLLGPVSAGAGVEGLLEIVLGTSAMRPEQAEDLVEACAHLATGLSAVRRMEQLAFDASHDPLTGLANRRTFEQVSARELKLAQRHGSPLSLLVLDVDHFKAYNDTFGHPAGDDLLRLLASTLRESVRSTDFIGRFGGEEFVILLPHTDAPGALRAANKVQEAIRAMPRHGRVLREQLTASIGTATCDGVPCEWLELLTAADQAMYRAKASGRDRICEA